MVLSYRQEIHLHIFNFLTKYFFIGPRQNLKCLYLGLQRIEIKFELHKLWILLLKEFRARVVKRCIEFLVVKNKSPFMIERGPHSFFSFQFRSFSFHSITDPLTIRNFRFGSFFPHKEKVSPCFWTFPTVDHSRFVRPIKIIWSSPTIVWMKKSRTVIVKDSFWIYLL